MEPIDAITPIIGTVNPDTLNGDQGSEVISGKGSDDTLSGNGGSDQVWGGSGSDLIKGNNGDDLLYGGGGPTYVTLSALSMAADYTATITFEGETAGYRNTLGWYKIDSDSNQIADVDIIWRNASLLGSGGDLIGGVSQETLDIQAGDQVGFFIVANGYSYNQSFLDGWDGSGHFEFQNADGSTATLDSDNPRLVHIAVDGSESELLHNKYHTAGYGDDVQLNPDDMDHTVGLLKTDEGVLRLGFEDLFNGGDRDFDDAVFSIDIGTINAKVLSGYSYDPDTGDLTGPASGGDGTPAGNVENDTIFGGKGIDSIYGRAGNDILSGGDGYDTLYGGSGQDISHGDSGGDTLSGGTGDDQLFGGKGHDSLDGGKGADTLYGDDGHDTLNGRSGDDLLYGGKGHDILEGSSGNDMLSGGSGHDTLSGGSGDDALLGGPGNDIFDGGSGNDEVSFLGAIKRVIANLSEGTSSGEGSDTFNSIEDLSGSIFDDKLYGNHKSNDLFGIDGDDRLYGRKGDDVLQGGGGDDYLDGGSGDDSIFGGAGDDILKGYTGDDTLRGGDGYDTFIYRSTNEGGDLILDFGIGEDLLDVSTLLEGLGATYGDNPMGNYLQAFDNGAGHTVLMVDSDGGGDDWSVELTTMENVNVDDFSVDSLIIV